MTRRSAPCALGAALVLLGLAACGGGSGTASDTGSETPTGDVSDPDPGDASDPGGRPDPGGTPDPGGGAVELTGDGPDDQPAPVALEDVSALEDHLAATAALGADAVTQALNDPETDTIVVSPSSLATALAMMAAGAEGVTRAELEEVLGGADSDVLEAIQSLRSELADLDQDPATIELDPLPDRAIVHMANQVVLRSDVTPEQTWLDAVSHRLGAGVVATPFEAMQQVLDDWVDLHTAGLVDESGIEARPETVLVVQDAVLVASAWLDGFSESATTEEDYTLPGGDIVQVPTMHGQRPMPYAEVDGHRAVELALLDGLVLEVVLPADGTAPGELTAEDWAALADALDPGAPALVDLALPRADLETSVALAPVLDPVGVVELFGPAPELGRMLPGDGYVVDQAVQQARLQIGEEGVVAAAVTEIAVAESAQLPPEEEVELVVDRPYAVRIVDGGTGWVLFHAAIGDPRGEE
ncbi:serpin family protein [Georgenia sp. Z1491]|uniref:serpin family protein n=1 Tax=Georgenia sp. Z1491 TaxID=3416707 RepID=UPI003CEC4F1E